MSINKLLVAVTFWESSGTQWWVSVCLLERGVTAMGGILGLAYCPSTASDTNGLLACTCRSVSAPNWNASMLGTVHLAAQQWTVCCHAPAGDPGLVGGHWWCPPYDTRLQSHQIRHCGENAAFPTGFQRDPLWFSCGSHLSGANSCAVAIIFCLPQSVLRYSCQTRISTIWHWQRTTRYGSIPVTQRVNVSLWSSCTFSSAKR